MSRANFPIDVSYSQICVFLSSLNQPFNNWNDRQFSQGFSWRPGSVSFKTVVAYGQHEVNLYINEQIPQLDSKCVRAIRVPFEVTEPDIEVASISDAVQLTVPVGTYSVQIEFLKTEEDGVYRLNLRLNSCATDFMILRADDEIDAQSPFDLMAEPAD